MKDNKKALRHRQLAEDWQRIAMTAEGRRVIADLMGWGWVYQPIEEADPIKLAMANGERNFAVRVARYLATEPDTFDQDMRKNDEAANDVFGKDNVAQFFKLNS